MGSLAVCTLVGRLTRDSELKYSNGGNPCAHFSIATDHRKKKGDTWVEEPSFWDVTLWGKKAETVNQYLTKGKLISCYGEMSFDRWEQDGQKREKLKITTNDVQLLSSDGKPTGEKRVQVDANNPTPFEDDSPIPF